MNDKYLAASRRGLANKPGVGLTIAKTSPSQSESSAAGGLPAHTDYSRFPDVILVYGV